MTPGNTVVLAKKIKVNRGTYLPGCRAYLVEVFPAENRWLVELSPTVRVKVPATSLRPEATCVYCGCTDSKACAGGCTWVELHRHTPTGVCSGCTEQFSSPVPRVGVPFEQTRYIPREFRDVLTLDEFLRITDEWDATEARRCKLIEKRIKTGSRTNEEEKEFRQLQRLLMLHRRLYAPLPTAEIKALTKQPRKS